MSDILELSFVSCSS